MYIGAGALRERGNKRPGFGHLSRKFFSQTNQHEVCSQSYGQGSSYFSQCQCRCQCQCQCHWWTRRNRPMKEATPSPLGPKFRTRSRGNGSDQEAGIEVAFLQQHVQEPCAAHTKSQPLVHSRWSWTAILCDAMISVTSAALHCWCLHQLQYPAALPLHRDFPLHSHLIFSSICNT